MQKIRCGLFIADAFYRLDGCNYSLMQNMRYGYAITNMKLKAQRAPRLRFCR